jgi:hypothetical protein
MVLPINMQQLVYTLAQLQQILAPQQQLAAQQQHQQEQQSQQQQQTYSSLQAIADYQQQVNQHQLMQEQHQRQHQPASSADAPVHAASPSPDGPSSVAIGSSQVGKPLAASSSGESSITPQASAAPPDQTYLHADASSASANLSHAGADLTQAPSSDALGPSQTEGSDLRPGRPRPASMSVVECRKALIPEEPLLGGPVTGILAAKLWGCQPLKSDANWRDTPNDGAKLGGQRGQAGKRSKQPLHLSEQRFKARASDDSVGAHSKAAGSAVRNGIDPPSNTSNNSSLPQAKQRGNHAALLDKPYLWDVLAPLELSSKRI